jgi:hypothetical protein
MDRTSIRSPPEHNVIADHVASAIRDAAETSSGHDRLCAHLPHLARDRAMSAGPAHCGASWSLESSSVWSPGELVWVSTWMAEANEVVAPRLGLAVLPVVDWPDEDEQPQRGVHWKTVPHAVDGRTTVRLAR